MNTWYIKNCLHNFQFLKNIEEGERNDSSKVYFLGGRYSTLGTADYANFFYMHS